MVKVKAITPEDRIEARHKDLSEEPDQEWQNPSYEVETGEKRVMTYLQDGTSFQKMNARRESWPAILWSG